MKPRKVIPLSTETDRVEKSNDLLGTLRDKGDLVQAGYAEMCKARSLFITKGLHPDGIAEQLGVDIRIVKAWILQFGWEERRQERIWKHQMGIRKTVYNQRGADLDVRHDNLAHSLENMLEEIIHQRTTPDGVDLTPGELKQLTNALRDLQGTRRLAHNKSTDNKAHVHKHEVPEDAKNIVIEVLGKIGMQGGIVTNERPKLTQLSPATDAEFEVLD